MTAYKEVRMFFRSINGSLVEEPKAKEVKLPDFPDDAFFTVRIVDPLNDPNKEYKSEPKVWIVCVAETGVRVGYGDTKDKAIQNANDTLLAFKAQFDRITGNVHLTTSEGEVTIPRRCCE